MAKRNAQIARGEQPRPFTLKYKNQRSRVSMYLDKQVSGVREERGERMSAN
jgi:hypothetical protein